MIIKWLSFIVSVLTFFALLVYAYLTYLIVKDIYNPLVSFNLKQIDSSHIGFTMVNKSKVEVEVFGKLWCKNGDEFFDFKDGFYGDKKHWILQPFTEGFGGGLDLKNLTNKDNVNLDTFVKNKLISSINFNLQIKYRKIGRKKWIKTSPQNFIYDFDNNSFYLNV